MCVCAGMCMLEGRRKEHIVEELRVKFWPTYKVSFHRQEVAQVLPVEYLVPNDLICMPIIEFPPPTHPCADGLAAMASSTGKVFTATHVA